MEHRQNALQIVPVQDSHTKWSQNALGAILEQKMHIDHNKLHYKLLYRNIIVFSARFAASYTLNGQKTVAEQLMHKKLRQNSHIRRI